MWNDLIPVGRSRSTGGYRRFSYTAAEVECRAWFHQEAAKRGLVSETDGNGNLWAWWGDPTAGDAVVTGSHLDSVPDGGAFDGPLGVVSGFAAVDALRAAGAVPRRPIGIAAFVEEEGGRFGIACLGSRLLTGAIDPTTAAGLVDADGHRLDDTMAAAGFDPAGLGHDAQRLARIGAYVELHVEQGRAQVDMDAPVAIGTSIWPHGRWRMEFRGRADHAGTTRLEDRADPMLTYANTVLAARKKARIAGAVATVGRVFCSPNGTNAIPSKVTGWLDARSADQQALDQVVAEVESATVSRAERDGTEVTISRESFSPEVTFDVPLRSRLASVLGDVPMLATGAGHDAGILASAVPTAMLFVRNPTGISHSPEEFAETADCIAGAEALTAVLRDLAC